MSRWASRRVVWVRWACQLAVEVAPVSAGRPIRSAWDSSRASISVSCAFAFCTSSMVAIVSAASIDHTLASATWVRSARASATARVTRWVW
jgi:hypothetical protein